MVFPALDLVCFTTTSSSLSSEFLVVRHALFPSFTVSPPFRTHSKYSRFCSSLPSGILPLHWPLSFCSSFPRLLLSPLFMPMISYAWIVHILYYPLDDYTYCAFFLATHVTPFVQVPHPFADIDIPVLTHTFSVHHLLHSYSSVPPLCSCPLFFILSLLSPFLMSPLTFLAPPFVFSLCSFSSLF